MRADRAGKGRHDVAAGTIGSEPFFDVPFFQARLPANKGQYVARSSVYRRLQDDEIRTLISQGCSCADWSTVQVAEGFRAIRVRNTHFAGEIRIGANGGQISLGAGVAKTCGIFHAYLSNCTIGDDVRIANVGVHVANYEIGDDVCIENVGTIATNPGATFGNGVAIEPLNEAGGREVILFNHLDSQFAHLMCLHRYRPPLIDRLNAMARAETEKAKADRGKIDSRARISNVAQMIDVNVGTAAVIEGAASLINGTILSSEDAPTTIGAGVMAEDFIIAESSQVKDGAILRKTYVGQGCQIGKQFSAEGSLFFANCEGFHGEACSVFAGPYSVSHHKSTLLIAGLFSFYNAGSGTNQSNHMYKLGPVHEGKLERGCKTGSFSYLMWPCRVGPFSVVLGKHTRTFDTSDFPFSHLEATPDGRCRMIPGLNLATVGTVRDGAKWPARDRRKGSLKRDRISFDVLSPLTVGRMLRGSARLQQLRETTDRAVDLVKLSGAEVSRVLLRTGEKFYRSGIQRYLCEKVVRHVEEALDGGQEGLRAALASSPEAVFSEQWVDIGGQMMPQQRLLDLCAAIEAGDIADLAAMNQRLDQIQAAYADDEWVWVKWAYGRVFDVDLDAAGVDELAQAAETFRDAQTKFLRMVLGDAGKEFEEATRTGFGQDGVDQEDADFLAVRGDYESNKFVKQLQSEADAVTERVAQFKQRLAACRTS